MVRDGETVPVPSSSAGLKTTTMELSKEDRAAQQQNSALTSKVVHVLASIFFIWLMCV